MRAEPRSHETRFRRRLSAEAFFFSGAAARAIATFFAVIFLSVAATAPASAQTAQDARILVIDMERVFRESAAARSIREQADAFRAETEARFAATRDELRREEIALTRLRDTLEREEFERRVATFEQNVRAFREERASSTTRLQTAQAQALEALRQSLQPVLLTFVQERGAQLLLDARAVIWRDPELDVTADVIARFDAETPRIDLDLGIGSDSEQ